MPRDALSLTLQYLFLSLLTTAKKHWSVVRLIFASLFANIIPSAAEAIRYVYNYAQKPRGNQPLPIILQV